MSASARVVSIARSLRAFTMARATARACRSSPSVAIIAARSRSLARATMSAALGPSCPMRMSSGPSSRNEKPRSAWSSCIDETPRSNTTPSTAASPAIDCKLANRSSTNSSRPCACATRSAPAGDRALIAIDADHACARRLQNGARISAGAESGVDIDAAVTHREPFDNAADKHRNMTRRSGSDSRAVAARHHVRAPEICAPKICAPKICAPKICAQSVALRLERHRGLLCARPDHLDMYGASWALRLGSHGSYGRQ